MPNYANRYISSLTRETYALILAGGRGSRLHELTDWRAKPAVYFGGKHRIIDFPLSNCINSGVRRVGIATQYKSHSLIRHVNRAWGHFKKELGESVEILPASQRQGDDWYCGTADAVFQNIDIIRHELPKYVMILSGDHVYRMDYGALLAEHVQKGADMTVCCIEVPVEEAADTFGVMTVDEENRVCRFDEKPAMPSSVPGKPGTCLASMGNYIFNTEFLFEQLKKDSENEGSGRDFGHDIIPAIIEEHNVFAFPFRDPNQEGQPYWRDVGTLDSFWEANMELVMPEPQLDLYDPTWPIWTYQEQLPPAKFIFDDEDRRGMALDSTVSGGCIISGSAVRKSLLFSNVHVRSFCTIEQSVILPGAVINRGCKIKRAIIDRSCEIPAGLEIGFDKKTDEENGFRVSKKGIVLVTRDMLTELAKKLERQARENKKLA
ncbi:glucose-1-phosphate adenylyltransferase [Pseudoalteromonas sp. NZS127_1]|jgi:glucose-1-phosphate adenylyltransferase|uniref:Glucose-1-phosphate adenylyltransferase n=7 Tax=Gammaproteobacteria TaxID=1236 RepID=F3BG33_9GAMM|nr:MULTISPECIES: glucose-1-phosphate adenylyltransferase [Pseudoalteromonas]ATC88847.1 glucose-1-phosphate adenylyltransferase [Pseudoalteromonas arctica A 37-1-2]EGI74394.1 glucose-1-phosphate adenylyltransferase [Pseudoalteromonas distincta]KAA1153162.1 glucose-1-phosphate adenylyltransferase [Pseudoalteromonas distincta]KAA1153650.1 glucose-1-phosphate adenylyltransferase [Pseudoalteromonas sp. FUC4]KHM46679.1 glucose-1-phosphate adenylyltransferase [Pseudoalteromonas elyakovii]|tara:strand:+ start:25745 stop:27046 length:1302 start_codon:yes stop_codon:yes gene_type:complete